MQIFPTVLRLRGTAAHSVCSRDASTSMSPHFSTSPREIKARVSVLERLSLHLSKLRRTIPLAWWTLRWTFSFGTSRPSRMCSRATNSTSGQIVKRCAGFALLLTLALWLGCATQTGHCVTRCGKCGRSARPVTSQRVADWRVTHWLCPKGHTTSTAEAIPVPATELTARPPMPPIPFRVATNTYILGTNMVYVLDGGTFVSEIGGGITNLSLPK